MIQRYAQFWFLRKGSGNRFFTKFSRKILLVLYSINWPNFMVWLPLRLEILGNTCIAVVCFPVCAVVNIKINLILLIKPFFYMAKTLRQNLKILRTKRTFKVRPKAFFINFKGFSVAKNCFRPETAPSLTCNFQITARLGIGLRCPLLKNLWSTRLEEFCKKSIFKRCAWGLQLY